jgi:hypothetical protein
MGYSHPKNSNNGRKQPSEVVVRPALANRQHKKPITLATYKK